MGIQQCQKHGPQGLFWACTHLSRQVKSGQCIPYRQVSTCFLCKACYKYTAASFVKSIPGLRTVAELWIDVWGYKKHVLMCPQCLKEAEYYTAKRDGQPLPFVGYERTLNWAHPNEVEKLEAALQLRFAFQPSRSPHANGSSLFVMPGSFTEPLTIYIYYVTDPGEQAQILAFVAEFFSTSDYPQRRVLFYEAERWLEKTRGNTTSYQFLEGVLLREELVA